MKWLALLVLAASSAASVQVGRWWADAEYLPRLLAAEQQLSAYRVAMADLRGRAESAEDAKKRAQSLADKLASASLSRVVKIRDVAEQSDGCSPVIQEFWRMRQ